MYVTEDVAWRGVRLGMLYVLLGIVLHEKDSDTPACELLCVEYPATMRWKPHMLYCSGGSSTDGCLSLVPWSAITELLANVVWMSCRRPDCLTDMGLKLTTRL